MRPKPLTIRVHGQCDLLWVTAVFLITFSGCSAVTGRDPSAATTIPTTSTDIPGDIAPIIDRLNAAGRSFQQCVGSSRGLLDPEQRKSKASMVIPILESIELDEERIQRLHPDFDLDAMPALKGSNILTPAMLCLFGDSKTQESLEHAAAGAGSEAARAGAILALADFWRTNADPAGQKKVLDAFSSLAMKYSMDHSLVTVTLMMTSFGSASDQSKTALSDILTGLRGTEAAAGVVEIKEESAELNKLRTYQGKPMVIKGTRVDGTPFTTADWQGHVVLVVFWATWCAPCVAEVPQVAKVSSRFHEKGLEIVGVSNDFDRDALETFLQRHREMDWPQLWDADAARQQKLNSITDQLGISGIPRIFLIDRQGVCRSVEAEDHLEELIEGTLDVPRK